MCAHLFHDGQYPRFGIVVSVSTDSQIDFLGVGIGFVRSSELKYAVRGREGDRFPDFWMDALKVGPMRRPDRCLPTDIFGSLVGVIWSVTCWILDLVDIRGMD